MPTLTQLNAMSQTDFTAALAGIVEATPEMATVTWPQRPFARIVWLRLVEVIQ
jgi:2-oxo-4-hydroxy-4-carboxy--5-ureidoimidazoline (OHCU) decarboxylase